MTDTKKIELLTEVMNKYEKMGNMTKMEHLETADWTRDERFNIIPQIAAMGRIDEIGVYMNPCREFLEWDSENYRIIKRILDTGVWMELPSVPKELC